MERDDLASPRPGLAGLLRSGLIAGLIALGAGEAAAHRPDARPQPAAAPPAALAELREALAKYRDPFVAVRDGYFSTVGCVVYPEGGMGIHFLNPGLIGPVIDPAKPQILLYEPDSEGRLELVGAEWFVPLATGVSERPSLLDQPFDGPMEGHEPLMPRELHHYDLHVWLFRDNPAGLFNAINPTVDCRYSPQRIMEGPPPIVAHR
ncbi:hypothetical protein [Elioraea rosea]|uniref:hypothetical protein n=1 Tax=Elioraea rosea TaxID=2492390 RepID=UPI001185F016|nr:hypothetical protein [Elioraea rosea]